MAYPSFKLHGGISKVFLLSTAILFWITCEQALAPPPPLPEVPCQYIACQEEGVGFWFDSQLAATPGDSVEPDICVIPGPLENSVCVVWADNSSGN